MRLVFFSLFLIFDFFVFCFLFSRGELTDVAVHVVGYLFACKEVRVRRREMGVRDEVAGLGNGGLD